MINRGKLLRKIEYEKRMPSSKMKEVGHANKLAGGFDNKFK